MSDINKHPLILSYIEYNLFGKLLGMHFEIIEKGNVTYYLKVEEKHLATPSAAHGGMITALLDATVGVGALSMVCEENKVVSTVEMKVTFLEPVNIGDELIARSNVIKKGNRILFVEGAVYKDDKIVAKASATLNAYPKEKAGF